MMEYFTNVVLPVVAPIAVGIIAGVIILALLWRVWKTTPSAKSQPLPTIDEWTELEAKAKKHFISAEVAKEKWREEEQDTLRELKLTILAQTRYLVKVPIYSDSQLGSQAATLALMINQVDFIKFMYDTYKLNVKFVFETPLIMVAKSELGSEFKVKYYISYQNIDRFVS